MNTRLFKKQTISVVTVLLSILYFLFSPSVFAASPHIYFEGPVVVAVGEEFTVKILVDTDQPVNAYLVSAVYPSDALSVVGVNQSNSVITIWQDQPSTSESGAIEIKGGSVSPFEGTRGELLSLRFKALHSGSFEFRFGNSFLYLANGKGTKISVATESLRFEIYEELRTGTSGGIAVNNEAIPDEDITPPDIKLMARTADPLNSSQKFFNFTVQDSGSGVRSISYKSKTWFLWNDSHPAMNPIAVPASVWAVSIKAVDYAGNSKERVFYDWAAFTRGPGLLGGLLGVIAAFLIYRRSKKMKIL